MWAAFHCDRTCEVHKLCVKLLCRIWQVLAHKFLGTLSGQTALQAEGAAHAVQHMV